MKNEAGQTYKKRDNPEEKDQTNFFGTADLTDELVDISDVLAGMDRALGMRTGMKVKKKSYDRTIGLCRC